MQILISGCSHAAGSEIDGNEDSQYNRDNSFGNLLGKKLGLNPINIAITGASNSCIARSTIEWCETHDTSDIKLVLVAWTDSSRFEVPSNRIYPYDNNNQYANWFSETAKDYMRVNMGFPGGDDEEKQLVPKYQKFIAEQLPWIEIYNLNLILEVEYYLKSKGLDYIMCATQPLFNSNRHTKFFENLIDKDKFYEFGREGFYWKFRRLGFKNKSAQYLHHDEAPHELYAQELYSEVKRKWR